MAANLPGLGPDDAVPSISPTLDAAAARLTPEDYFVLTRVDGKTSFRQLVLISGFPEGKAISILAKLRAAGALVLPGDPPPRPPEPPPPPPPPPRQATHRASSTKPPGERVITPPMGVFVDDIIMTEDVDLTIDQKRDILAKHKVLRGADLFTVLGVGRDADRRALKNAYRTLSKSFHPDRFFGKRLGSFKQMLAEIFDLASSALDILSDPERREIYVASLRDTTTPVGGVRVTVQRRAVEIFEDACAHHLSGDLSEAAAMFSAAIALDPQPRFLRRAAEVAALMQELRLAEEYAKKATELDPEHASGHRIHAKVLEAAGRRDEARVALERARRLDPDNPHIAAELRDLERSSQP